MYSGDDLKAFRKQWNQTADGSKELVRFRIRADEVLRYAWNGYFGPSDRLRSKFALISGTEYLNWERKDYAYSDLCVMFQNDPPLYEVIEAIQFVLWTLRDHHSEGLMDVCNRLRVVLDASPEIPVRLVLQSDTATLYPMGAKLLDEAVIEANLAWLEKFPEVAKPFEAALKIYLRKDPSQYRNLLDSLRLSVEQMLRAVLNNRKNLENQKEEFLRWMAKDAHSQIVNMYSDVLARLAQYQNDAVKHNEDQYTLAEVEFTLYLTGTLLRFIQRASEQRTSSVTTS